MFRALLVATAFGACLPTSLLAQAAPVILSSDTPPQEVLTLRFEAHTAALLAEIQALLRAANGRGGNARGWRAPRQAEREHPHETGRARTCASVLACRARTWFFGLRLRRELVGVVVDCAQAHARSGR